MTHPKAKIYQIKHTTSVFKLYSRFTGTYSNWKDAVTLREAGLRAETAFR